MLSKMRANLKREHLTAAIKILGYDYQEENPGL